MDDRRHVLEELQCIICHECLYKPLSLGCGHTFCRVCLLQACEAQGPGTKCTCPVCREPLCGCLDSLNVNLTLWNVIRIVYPDGKSEADEEVAFQAAKASFELHQQLRRMMLPEAPDHDGAAFNDYVGGREDHEDRRHLRLEINAHEDAMRLFASDSDDTPDEHDNGNDNDSDAENSSPWVVRVENLEADELRIRRNVVVDQDDINTDGNLTMRNAFGIVEFPSILQAYADGQDCQIALLQLEEDEEQTEGFPVFMAESGEDDRLVFPQYFSDVRLTVSPVDDPGQPVLVRTASASHGMVEFKNLRLHVPPGGYVFRMDDFERELYIEVRTHISNGGGPDSPHHAAPRLPQPDAVWRFSDRSMHRPQAATLHRRGRDDYSDDDMLYEDEENAYDSDDSFLASEDEESGRWQRRRAQRSHDGDDLDQSADERAGVDVAAQDAAQAAIHDDDGGDENEEDNDVVVVRAPASRKRARRQVESSDDEEDESLHRLAFKRRQRAIASEDDDSDLASADDG